MGDADSATIQVAIARLEEQVRTIDTRGVSLSADLKEIRTDNKNIRESIAKLDRNYSEIRGGWKVMAAMAAAAGTLGGLVNHLWPNGGGTGG